MLPDWMIEKLAKEGMIVPFAEGMKRPGMISFGLSSMGYDVRLGYKFKTPKTTFLNNAVIDPKAPPEDQNANYDLLDLSPARHEWKKHSRGLRYVPQFKCQVCDAVYEGKQLPDDLHQQVCTVASQNIPDHIIIPPKSFVLGESLEEFDIPRDLAVVVVGKSTYARTALVVNVTPGEPEWKGKWTIELSNTNIMPIKVYVGEGIFQAMFFQSQGVIHAALAEVADWMKEQEDKTEDSFWSPELKELRRILDRVSLVGSCARSYKDKQGKYHLQDGLTLPKVDT